MGDDSAALRVDPTGAALTIRFQRPPANAFDVPMAEALRRHLELAAGDPGVRCVCLTGSGRFFSAGQDVSTIAQASPDVVRRALDEIYHPLILLLRMMPKPILAAVNGPAAGMGLGLALAADMRLAARSARFVFGFSALGLTSDCGVSLLLAGWVGAGRALAMALSEEPLDAEQARHAGLAAAVVEDEDLAAEAEAWSQRLAAGPTLAYGLTKQAINEAVFSDLDGKLAGEAVRQTLAAGTADAGEGVRAFLEKRRPVFRGA